MLPATKPAAAVVTTRALSPSLDSCLYDWAVERSVAQACPVSRLTGSSRTPSAVLLDAQRLECWLAVPR